MLTLLFGLAVLILGIFAGIFISSFVMAAKIIGTLAIDKSDPDGPHMFLELEKKNTDEIMQRAFVVLKVEERNYISQK